MHAPSRRLLPWLIVVALPVFGAERIIRFEISEQKTVTSADGAKLAEMTVYGSVAEDPAFTLIVDDASGDPLAVAARDTNGLEFSGALSPASGRRIASARP